MSKFNALAMQNERLLTLLRLDYCIAAFGIIIVISVIQWIIDGRKNFTGPRTDMDILTGQLPVGQFPVDNSKATHEELEK
jgi:choline transport protein